MSAPRSTQIDGWRALAALGVMWLHLAPAAWRGPFPWEIGLFFFLTLTGFLITRVLMRDRDQGEASGQAWRVSSLRDFLHRRATRLLLPCYAAMILAWILGAPDIRAHPLVYLAHLANFRIAFMPDYPVATAHYWTLAIQVGFYLVWPLLIYLAPRRALVPLLVAFAALAPLTRWICGHYFPEIPHPGALTPAAADYFAAGALLAIAMRRGMKAGDRRLGAAGLVAFALYVPLYYLNRSGHSVDGLCHFQQTFVSLAFAALISRTLAGFGGPLGWMLDHPSVQHLGRLSYGLYLFHTCAPMALGKVLPWLWLPVFDGPLQAIRLIIIGLAAWGLAWLCWRYLEQPVHRPAAGR